MLTRFINPIILFLLPLVISACGGGSGGSSSNSNAITELVLIEPSSAASLSLSFQQTKQFVFSWTDVGDATEYRLMENSDGSSGFTQIGDAIASGIETVSITVPLYQRVNAQYLLQSCNGSSCIDSEAVAVDGSLADSIGYIKASNTGTDDYFGRVSISEDGNTLAVGAVDEQSNATGINGNQLDNSLFESGAVYVFVRSGAAWTQEAYIKPSNTGNDDFGGSVSLSDDGNTLAVGADDESSNATGINGDQSDNSADRSGAVYVFVRSGTTWSQQAYVKASNTDINDSFGSRVSINSDGNTLAVTAYDEQSNATGINGDQTNNSVDYAGAVYIFVRSGTTWSQQAYIKASNTGIAVLAGDEFGASLDLNADGNVLVVGAVNENGGSAGINGDQSDLSKSRSGAVYVFTRNNTTWSQQAYIKASNTDIGDNFGDSVSISDDGNILAVGAADEQSSAIGINGNQLDNSANRSGAVYMFVRNGTTWTQEAYIKASNTDSEDGFGGKISLSSSGNTLAVGAYEEGSSATGINGDQSDNSAVESGAAYVFTRNDGIWAQQAYITASNSESDDNFVYVELGEDGNILVVGATGESSSSTGIDNDQNDNSAKNSGAVYIY
jgi:hypothetical protein